MAIRKKNIPLMGRARVSLTSIYIFWGYFVMLERDFQSGLIKDIKERFPGCMVLKNDPSYIQGIPDLIILHGDKWAALEVKKSKNSKRRPNQEHYISKMNEMSFSALVYPENKEDILDAIQRSFQSPRSARVSKRK